MKGPNGVCIRPRGVGVLFPLLVDLKLILKHAKVNGPARMHVDISDFQSGANGDDFCGADCETISDRYSACRGKTQARARAVYPKPPCPAKSQIFKCAKFGPELPSS